MLWTCLDTIFHVIQPLQIGRKKKLIFRTAVKSFTVPSPHPSMQKQPQKVSNFADRNSSQIIFPAAPTTVLSIWLPPLLSSSSYYTPAAPATHTTLMLLLILSCCCLYIKVLTHTVRTKDRENGNIWFSALGVLCDILIFIWSKSSEIMYFSFQKYACYKHDLKIINNKFNFLKNYLENIFFSILILITEAIQLCATTLVPRSSFSSCSKRAWLLFCFAVLEKRLLTETSLFRQN